MAALVTQWVQLTSGTQHGVREKLLTPGGLHVECSPSSVDFGRILRVDEVNNIARAGAERHISDGVLLLLHVNVFGDLVIPNMRQKGKARKSEGSWCGSVCRVH